MSITHLIVPCHGISHDEVDLILKDVLVVILRLSGWGAAYKGKSIGFMRNITKVGVNPM